MVSFFEVDEIYIHHERSGVCKRGRGMSFGFIRERMPEVPLNGALLLWGRVGVPLEKAKPFSREPGMGAANK